MRTLVLAGALCLSVSLASAATITEVPAGAGNTLATAQAIPGAAFTLPIPATVFPSAGSTATITGGLQTDGDVDFYSFTLASATNVMFDVDNDPFTFDTMLSLFDSTGTLIAFDDDSFPPDLGSQFAQDSFIGVLPLGAGTYYFAVSYWWNVANASSSGTQVRLNRPDGRRGGSLVVGATPGDSSMTWSVPETAAGGTAYTLHVSRDVRVPEPALLVLLGLGLAGVGRSRRKRL